MRRVVIVGGGITGLAAAYRLRRAAPEVSVTLLEAGERLGGIVRTVREDGFTVEAGPDSFLASKPAGLRLCRDLGIEDRLIPPCAANRGSFVLHDGRLHSIPEGLTGLVPSRLEPLLDSPLFSPEGKKRLTREPDIPAREGDGDESLAGFIERRFGPEVYERLVEPLMAGIYAGDGRQLSLGATFPQLAEMERRHGGVFRAVAERGTATPSGPTGFLAPREGMQVVVDALAQALGEADFRCGETVRRIDRERHEWVVRTDGAVHLADAVIVALPAVAAAAVTQQLDPVLGEALASVPAASNATVTLAYRSSEIRHGLNGFGYIIPRAESRPALACTWISSKWPGRAPAGYSLLRVFLGRYGQEYTLDVPDDALVELARAELAATMDVTAPPARVWLFRLFRAMPQYLVGHCDRIARIQSALQRLPGLQLAGNAYSGVGIPDCIRSGEEAVAGVLSGLPPR